MPYLNSQDRSVGIGTPSSEDTSAIGTPLASSDGLATGETEGGIPPLPHYLVGRPGDTRKTHDSEASWDTVLAT